MTVLAAIALLAWLYLLAAHGRFWQAGPTLPAARPVRMPAVAVVVPARDEADGVADALRSLLRQDYAGTLRVVLVDDGSRDGTGEIARGVAGEAASPAASVPREAAPGRLAVLSGLPRPPGWSGKLWAIAQGIDAAGPAELVLLTDADIIHEPGHLAALVAHAEAHDLDLVSEMVALRCETAAERALVPAFVFFFQLLYPFAWVNDPLRSTAAAAGGTILIRRRALDRIGGIEVVCGALIDDVALAGAVKRGGRIWLGHSTLAVSRRAYPAAADVWRMVARTAYVQLRRSPLLLAATIAGLALVWLVPPAVALAGEGAARWMGLAAWAGASAAFVPTLRRFGLSPLRAPLLPLVAVFYMAATIGSAFDHHRGRGVQWRGRRYGGADA
ncbi:MAG TPA: glycosyltransferase [Acetobacteraceae bacterium]|nr:glycosyltransferase [Acetobacteraceae bacterium]